MYNQAQLAVRWSDQGPKGSLLHARLQAYGELVTAVKSKNMMAAEKILTMLPGKANSEIARGGAGPLHYAVLWGSVELARLLLKNGADPNKANTNGCTPLHFISFASLPSSSAVSAASSSSAADASSAGGKAALQDELWALLVLAGAKDSIYGLSGLWLGSKTPAELRFVSSSIHQHQPKTEGDSEDCTGASAAGAAEGSNGVGSVGEDAEDGCGGGSTNTAQIEVDSGAVSFREMVPASSEVVPAPAPAPAAAHAVAVLPFSRPAVRAGNEQSRGTPT